MKPRTKALLTTATALVFCASQAFAVTQVGGADMFENRNIVENAVNSPIHKTLVAAVRAAGLEETLSGDGPFTVFAPTDFAFADLPEGVVEGLLEPDRKDQLTAVLTCHVVSGDMSYYALRKMIEDAGGTAEIETLGGCVLTGEMDGNRITVTDENGTLARVLVPDVAQSNGVIHVIDAVILPTMLPASGDAMSEETATEEDMEEGMTEEMADDEGMAEGMEGGAAMDEKMADSEGMDEGMSDSEEMADEGAMNEGMSDAEEVAEEGAMEEGMDDGAVAEEDMVEDGSSEGEMADDKAMEESAGDDMGQGDMDNEGDMAKGEGEGASEGGMEMADENKNPTVGGAPMFADKTIVENAINSPVHTILVDAVVVADLADTLSGEGPFTVFAPVDAAFDALPSDTVPTLLMEENRDQLVEILTCHVVAADVMSDALIGMIEDDGGVHEIETVGGCTIKASLVDGKVMIEDEQGGMATVTTADVDQSNGVVHVIDRVLLPAM